MLVEGLRNLFNNDIIFVQTCVFLTCELISLLYFV